MKHTTLLYLIFFCTYMEHTLVGQPLNLTCEEKLEIKKRAQLKLEEFEALLRFIADPTRSRGAVDQAIKSSYTDGKFFKQVFYDSTVRIENDILPYMDASSESDIAVDAYLNQFKLFYEKSRESTIFFENVWFSDIQENQFVYMVASYQSRFTGTHRELKSMTYQPQSRSATLRAEYNTKLDHWEVWIVGVTYRRENKLPSFPADPCATDTITTSDTTNITEIANTAKVTDTSDTTVTNNISDSTATSLEFVDTANKYKRGKLYQIAWNDTIQDGELHLYRREQPLGELTKALDGAQWSWNVKQKPGKNYSIMLYEPSTNRRVKSEVFRIRSSFPLAIKIAIPAAAVGYLIIAKQKEWFPFKDSFKKDEYLPGPKEPARP